MTCILFISLREVKAAIDVQVEITAFTLAATSDFAVPEVGDQISFPSNVYVKSTTPNSLTNRLHMTDTWTGGINEYTSYDPPAAL